jgi:hypothetical protein
LETAPSLKSYDYQAWDDATRTFVNDVLRMYLNPGDSIAEMTSSAPKKSAQSATAVAEKPTEAPAKTESTSSVSTDDDLDSFLNDLDI